MTDRSRVSQCMLKIDLTPLTKIQERQIRLSLRPPSWKRLSGVTLLTLLLMPKSKLVAVTTAALLIEQTLQARARVQY